MEKFSHVLIIDDDKNFRRTLSDILSIKGYTTSSCATGGEAFEIIHQEMIIVALIDLHLEDMTGLEVLSVIKKHSPKTECIVLTGFASQATAIDAVNLGAYSYFQKPYDLDQLILSIHNAANKYRSDTELIESQRQLATLMSNLPGMAYRCNNDSMWTMIFVSEGCYSLTGYQPEDFYENAKISYVQVIHPEDRAKVSDNIQYALKQKSPFEITYRIVTAGGGEKWVWEQGRGVLNDQGDLLAIEGFITDITERQHAVDEIRRLNATLEQRVQQRTIQLSALNKELEAFSYSVSHDLRAPLRAMDGFSAVLLREYSGKLDETGKHYLERIREATQRMSQLIDDLLKLSRVTRTEFNRYPVDLSQLAFEIATELKAEHPDREIDFEITPKLMAQVDSHLMRIVLENLFSNAVKFTSQRDRAIIQFGANQQSGECVYFVRDNGVGFDMKYAGKLFAPFQRLHSAKEYPGTGVGLVTVQRIINRHAGQIWSDATVDQGATFYFTLGNHLY